MAPIRRLKYHEQKLLKKVDFLDWEGDSVDFKKRVLEAIAIFKLRDQQEYMKYHKIAKEINIALDKVRKLPDDDNFRTFKKVQLELLITKLYQMGVLNDRNLDYTGKISAEMICRRRISYIMFKEHFAESVNLACLYISHGHVRIGPEVISDPAYLVTRNLEDFISWVDASKIKKTILKFNEELDDYNNV